VIRALDARVLGLDAVVAALERSPETAAPEIHRAVDDILAAVRARGDAALLECTARFDGFRAPSAAALAIPPAEFEAAERALAPATRAALAYAAERIERYHAAAAPKSWRLTDEHGSVLGQEVRPLDRIGVYVPGGRAAYPSTVLMTAVPARVAGVREVVLVTPPGRDGGVEPVVLAAACLAGVTEGWRLGGAQAVAALAYGTATIRRVDKIVGPGNIYVALAKARVFGEVGIDMLAGPSEVVVVADARADARWIAADLLAQAEHDASAQAILITDDAALADRVERYDPATMVVSKGAVLWLAHTEELCEQAYACFKQVWEASTQVAPLLLVRFWGRYTQDLERHRDALAKWFTPLASSSQRRNEWSIC